MAIHGISIQIRPGFSKIQEISSDFQRFHGISRYSQEMYCSRFQSFIVLIQVSLRWTNFLEILSHNRGFFSIILEFMRSFPILLEMIRFYWISRDFTEFHGTSRDYMRFRGLTYRLCRKLFRFLSRSWDFTLLRGISWFTNSSDIKGLKKISYRLFRNFIRSL